MKILLLIITAFILFYLLVFPVPIEPKSWDAPKDAGYSGAHARNSRLGAMSLVSIEPFSGPEDALCNDDGGLVTVSDQGAVLEIAPDGAVSVSARLGGRPLGIVAGADDQLIVANAELGLQYLTAERTIGKLTSKVAGNRIIYANNAARHSDGRVFFSQASTHFDPRKYQGTLAASLLDILEHDPNGRLLVYNPDDKRTDVLLTGLAFANGVALSPDERYLLIAETAKYRIARYWLQGPDAGKSEIILNNLPGFPDNITTGRDGRYWVGLTAPRAAILDTLSDKPFLRKVVQRLPTFLRPKAAPYSHVIAIDGNGKVLHDLQHDGSILALTTGACETETDLYITSLTAAALGRISKQAAGL